MRLATVGTGLAGGFLLLSSMFYAGYLRGWYGHSEKVNRDYAVKQLQVSEAWLEQEQLATKTAEEGKVVYRTIYKDVVKYVQVPTRNQCDFDQSAVQLRQQALDYANTLSGYDEPAMQRGEQSRDK
ncbi:hypothetical protein HGT73_05410 [Rosenbergiella australiborealis]|uniref:Lipoprotein n=1 Tax=Rosenbergiella australiborealis TaxID=1544696 RepID=A0ABS5T5N5_9GAMM|nr:hypothetical protein [Rosenbergiella australiborealis]MBT0726825.1 hypothetical protein [Rosenbergiella australiborealis]